MGNMTPFTRANQIKFLKLDIEFKHKYNLENNIQRIFKEAFLIFRNICTFSHNYKKYNNFNFSLCKGTNGFLIVWPFYSNSQKIVKVLNLLNPEGTLIRTMPDL